MNLVAEALLVQSSSTIIFMPSKFAYVMTAAEKRAESAGANRLAIDAHNDIKPRRQFSMHMPLYLEFKVPDHRIHAYVHDSNT